jgi:hypothetical protein
MNQVKRLHDLPMLVPVTHACPGLIILPTKFFTLLIFLFHNRAQMCVYRERERERERERINITHVYDSMVLQVINSA